MIRKAREYLKKQDYTVRENLIIYVMTIGFIIGSLAFIEELFVSASIIAMVPMAAILVGLTVGMFLIFRFRKFDLAIALFGLVTVVLAFPFVFFLNGGIEGGATIWFVLGIFFFIAMFDGKKMVIFTTITIIVDAITYFCAYNYSEYMQYMDSKMSIYSDSMFAVLLVGIMLGVIVKFQLGEYAKERKLAIKQKEEIERFSDSKNDFFASLSHEIRTPINTIIGLNEMMLRDEKLSEENVENAVTIQNATKMLLSLVNDILDLSQIESKKMEIFPVEYKSTVLFSDLVDMIRSRMEEKGIAFNVRIDKDFPTSLFGDEKRLKQIILNLLTNAVKYTKQGSVTLEARAEKIGEEWVNVTISVIDTGIGIRSENLETLFDSFKIVEENVPNKIEGTGLGLSISKQLVELMGGKITVDSIYTKGSTFTVMLEQQIINPYPIGNINFLSNNKQREHYKQRFEAPEARVLVVDDNVLNRSVITKLLKATKLQIDTAEDGTSCLDMTHKKYYNVILMDYMMPGMNGDEVAKAVRKQEGGLCRNTPIIALTADATLGIKTNLNEFGFDAFVDKPIKSSELEETILRFLPEEVIEYQLKVYDKESLSRNDERIYHKRKKLVVSTDCVCDLSQEVTNQFEIKTIYSYINTEGSRFCDTLEIDSNNLGMFMSETTSTATAEAASVEDYERFFAECLTESEEVIHISLGKNMGESYRNAVDAAKGFGHVHVVDSGHLSGGMALVVLDAARLVQRGGSTKEVLDEIEAIKDNIHSYFILPSSQIFYQNGYVNGFVAKIVHALKLHPVLKNKASSLSFYGVRIGSLNKSRTRFIKQHILWKKNHHGDVCYITYAGLSVKEQEAIYKVVKDSGIFSRIIMQKSSVTNACFSGLGTVGLAFYVEK